MDVSVIITTRDRPQQLSQACQSVFRQTIKPQEIIIVDDGSQITIDRLSLEQLCPQEINIKIERFDSSQGACIARNKGAELASGDILMFLDDDDTWEENKIRDQLLVFKSNTEIGLVYSGKLIVKENAREKVLYKVKPRAAGKIYPQILSCNLIGSTSSVALKKLLFEEVGGFDKNMPAFQDYDLWLRCCQKTIVGHDRSYNLKYTLSANPNQQISGQSHCYIEASRQILAKYRQELESQGALATRKFSAGKFFYIAKSLRWQGLKAATPWIIASVFQYPSWRAIALILPPQITQWLRNSLQYYFGSK